MKKLSIVFMIMCTILFSGINAQAAALSKLNSDAVYTSYDMPKNIVLPADVREFEIYIFDNYKYLFSPAFIYMNNNFYKLNLPAYFSRGLIVYGTPTDVPGNVNGKYLGYSLLGNPVQDVYYIEQGDFKNVTFIKNPWQYANLKASDEALLKWNGTVDLDNNVKLDYISAFKNMKTVNGIYLKDLLKSENYFEYAVPAGDWFPDKAGFAVLYYIDINNADDNLKMEIKKLYVMTSLNK